MRFAAILLLICLSFGCATMKVPTAAEQAAADYGPEPLSYVNAVHQYFDSAMKDPSSVQYREIERPIKGYVNHGGGLLVSKYATYGWLVRATINAKNSYGGYVGFRTYTFLFRGEQIVDELLPPDESLP